MSITRKIFLIFFVVSLFALAYINMTSYDSLKSIAELFPEIDIILRKAFIRGYKMAMSLAVFFVDILLVGPFAWLSYFSDHIVAKRVGLIDKFGGNLMRDVSFFDLGILLATDFTVAVIAFNFTLVNAVDKTPITFISPSILWWLSAVGLVAWALAALIKIYSYTSDQRSDLKKYIIKF